ncbi:hypothetical protein [Achromobacter marplatensis]|uniref:hypothetical protein n=1 Tax=Achromobacter marplatensis TaxID=470868 RepID=UPI000277E3E5|nr:hypothetical protein [Achromobacter marplatensis]EJO30526.1 hypothetical protein QWC_17102 [Achromobacter marplatensis]
MNEFDASEVDRRSPAQLLEAAWPLILGTAAATAAWFFNWTFSPARYDGQLAATISISSILTGFLGTAQAIMLTVTSGRMSWLQANRDVWGQVLSFFRVALLANLWLCIWSLVLSSTEIARWPAPLQPLLFPLWVGSVVVAILSFYKALTLLFLLLRR